MKNLREQCKAWVLSHNVDERTKAQAITILNDDEQLKACFGSDLSFGTAGLRGIMGPGTNRMNINTVCRATRGIGEYIVSLGREAMLRGVVIAHDSRNCGVAFAQATALTLAALGVRAYVFDELRPTPELSFAVRQKGAIMGINITASHNPKEYNGYKVYFEDGAQIAGELADILQEKIAAVDPLMVERMSMDEAVRDGLYVTIGKDFDEEYLAAVMAEKLPMDDLGERGKELKVVYTPFHGTGYRLVPMLMNRLGISVETVDEQMIPDGEFSTLASPNPEEKAGFALGIEKAKKIGAELIVATDPDADRVGVGCLDTNGEISLLTGNQIGVLLLDFICRRLSETGKMPYKPAVVTSLVSTKMTEAICKEWNVELFTCLTGFKYIGEHIAEFEKTGANSFLFGFEESYGYLKGTYARDKDAVVATMLIIQMAMYYKDQGMTLPMALQKLYRHYGFYAEKTINVKIDGLEPKAKMDMLMKNLRENAPEKVGYNRVLAVGDYLEGVIREGQDVRSTGKPKSDVLTFTMEDDATVIVRPSGTEPKVKLYLLTSGNSLADCESKIEFYEKEFGEKLK